MKKLIVNSFDKNLFASIHDIALEHKIDEILVNLTTDSLKYLRLNDMLVISKILIDVSDELKITSRFKIDLESKTRQFNILLNRLNDYNIKYELDVIAGTNSDNSIYDILNHQDIGNYFLLKKLDLNVNLLINSSWGHTDVVTEALLIRDALNCNVNISVTDNHRVKFSIDDYINFTRVSDRLDYFNQMSEGNIISLFSELKNELLILNSDLSVKSHLYEESKSLRLFLNHDSRKNIPNFN